MNLTHDSKLPLLLREERLPPLIRKGRPPCQLVVASHPFLIMGVQPPLFKKIIFNIF
jgi:hypothetical protein